MRCNFVDSRWQKKEEKERQKLKTCSELFPFLFLYDNTDRIFSLVFWFKQKTDHKNKICRGGRAFYNFFFKHQVEGVKSGWHHASLLKCGRLSLTATESQKGSRGICVSSWGSDTFVPYFPTHFECTPEISFGVRGRISNGRLGSLGLEVSLRCSSQYLGELYPAENNLCIDIGNIYTKDKYGI